MKNMLFVYAGIAALFCLFLFLCASSPTLTLIFELIWIGGALACVLVWVCLNRGWLQQQLRKFRQRCLTWSWRSEPETLPLEQLRFVLQEVQRIRCVLYGTTPEQERVRRLPFQERGELVPALVILPQYALFAAEFQSLLNVLQHFGFPTLENVWLQAEDLDFILHWIQDFDTRMREQQTHTDEQQQSLRVALQVLTHQHQQLGQKYAPTQWHVGYLRMQGALRLLEEIASDPACPGELAQRMVQLLRKDMRMLTAQFEQTSL